MTTEPTVVRFPDDPTYRADPGYNFSKIKQAIDGSMADLRHDIENALPFKTTPAMQLGTLVHHMVLEPLSDWMDEYAVTYATDRRTKLYKLAKQQADEAGKTLIPASVKEHAAAMSQSVFANPFFKALMQGDNTAEVGMAYDDVALGLRLKGKYDLLVNDSAMVDLKTTSERLNVDQLSKLIVSRHYHVQQALYWRILRAVRPELCEHPTHMGWMFVRSVGAHDTVLVWADEEIVAHAESELDHLLVRLSRAHTSGDWPGLHPKGVVTASLPRWAKIREPAVPTNLTALPS